MDPFSPDDVVGIDLSNQHGSTEQVDSSLSRRVSSDLGFLLPVSLAFVIFVGALMPWVRIRPLGDTKYSYNLTDVPGGMGILVTCGLLTVIGAVILGFRRRAGLTIMSVTAGSLGWMASMSGLLLGLVGSMIPAISVAGIDLAKAQVGQGSGVVVSITGSLLLGIIAIRQYDPVSRLSSNLSIRILPIGALIPLILIAVNHHAGWLVLGNEASGWKAEVPGDALYGSGLILLFLYFIIGVWFLALIIRTDEILISASIASIVIAAFSGMYAVFVWLGGKTLNWLVPQSLGDWSKTSVEAPLYVSFFSSIVLLVVSVLGFFPEINRATIAFKEKTDVSSRSVKTGDIIGLVIILVTIIWLVLSNIL